MNVLNFLDKVPESRHSLITYLSQSTQPENMKRDSLTWNFTGTVVERGPFKNKTQFFNYLENLR